MQACMKWPDRWKYSMEQLKQHTVLRNPGPLRITAAGARLDAARR